MSLIVRTCACVCVCSKLWQRINSKVSVNLDTSSHSREQPKADPDQDQEVQVLIAYNVNRSPLANSIDSNHLVAIFLPGADLRVHRTAAAAAQKEHPGAPSERHQQRQSSGPRRRIGEELLLAWYVNERAWRPSADIPKLVIWICAPPPPRTADTRSNGGGGDARARHYTPQAAAHQMSHPTVAPRDTLEQSWIYALCMRCRVEYNTPSWEPPHWQLVCPFPLCPSYRQFANILSIFMIGESVPACAMGDGGWRLADWGVAVWVWWVCI